MEELLPVRKPGFRIGASFRIAFSEDGVHLATVGRRVTTWSVAARQRVGRVHPFSHESEVDLSPDAEWLVVKNTLGDVVVLARETLAERLRLSGKPYGEGSDIRFSPCGRFLLDGSWAGDLLVRDVETGEVVLHEQPGGVSVLRCSRDRMTWLYDTPDAGFVIRRWPFVDNEPVPVLPPDKQRMTTWTAAVSDDGQFFARVVGNQIESWRLDPSGGRGELIGRYAVPISGTGNALAWHPNEALLAYTGAPYALVLTPALQSLWQGQFEYASDVAFSPDGALLGVGDWSKGSILALDQLNIEDVSGEISFTDGVDVASAARS